MITRFVNTQLRWRTFWWGILASAVCGAVANTIYYVQGIRFVPFSLIRELEIAFTGAMTGVFMGVALGIPTFILTGVFLSFLKTSTFFQPPISITKRWSMYLLTACCAAFSSGMFMFLLINLPSELRSGGMIEHALRNSLSYAAILAPAGLWTARQVLLYTPKKKNGAVAVQGIDQSELSAEVDELAYRSPP